MRATPSEYFQPIRRETGNIQLNPYQTTPAQMGPTIPYQIEPTQADLFMPIVAIAIVAGVALGIGLALLLRKRTRKGVLCLVLVSR